MKKLAVAAVCAACFSTAALAENPTSGVLPYGMGLTLGNDISYAVDAETITAEPSATVDWMGAYAGVTPTLDVDEFELTNVEIEVGYSTSLIGVDVNPYVKMNTDGDGEYQDTVIGFSTSVKF